MRFRNPSLLAACSLLAALPVKADVIVLKNGEKLNGIVLRQDGDHYVVEVKVTATIRDERIIPRAEVERIEKEAEDAKAFTVIAGLLPTPELLGKEGYEERIGLIEDFIKDYPASSKIAKAKEMLEALKAELALIAEGGIRYGEGIVSAADYEADAYAYDSRIAEKSIRDAVSRRDLLGALRKYDAYEKNFGHTEGRAGLTALMLQVMNSYRNDIAASLAGLDDRLKAREAGLARMTPDDRARSQRALNDQEAEATKRLEEEKAAQSKWVTPHDFHKESLAEAERQVTAEITRLERPPEAPAIPLEEVFRSAWKKLPELSEEAKKAVLDDAKAKLLPEPYLAKLSARAGLAAP